MTVHRHDWERLGEYDGCALWRCKSCDGHRWRGVGDFRPPAYGYALPPMSRQMYDAACKTLDPGSVQ